MTNTTKTLNLSDLEAMPEIVQEIHHPVYASPKAAPMVFSHFDGDLAVYTAAIPAPVDGYTAADVLRLAREHNITGRLVSRGRRFEKRAYPVVNPHTGKAQDAIIVALPEQHHTAEAK